MIFGYVEISYRSFLSISLNQEIMQLFNLFDRVTLQDNAAIHAFGTRDKLRARVWARIVTEPVYTRSVHARGYGRVYSRAKVKQ